MKTMVIVAAVVLGSVFGLTVSDTSAQGFSSILEKLDRLEGRINALDTTQRNDIQQMKKQLSTTPPAADTSVLINTIAELQTEVKRLSGDLEQVKASAAQMGNDETIGNLTMELRGLIGDLRGALSENRQSEAPVVAPVPNATSSENRQSEAPVVAPVSNATSIEGLNVSVDAGVDVYSQYVWRGFLLANKSSVQPSVTFGFGETGLALNIWGSAATYDRGGKAGLEASDELDFTLSYDQSFGLADVSLGYIQYTFPNLTGTKHSEEVYASVSLDNIVAPSVTAAYDFGLANAWYLAAGIGPEFSLNSQGTASLGFGASVGFSNAARSFGFNDVTLSTSLGLQWKNVSFTPSFGFSYADEAVNAAKDAFWGGFGVGISY